MNVRRSALPLLTALLVGGCVGLPKPSAPPAPQPPQTGPPALAPADRRPPSPLPSPLPERPVEAAPREELGAVEPREGTGEAGVVPVRDPGAPPVPVRPRGGEGREPAGYGDGAAPRTPAPRSAGSRPADPRPAAPRPAKKKPRPPEARAATPPPRGPVPAPAATNRPAAGGQAPDMRSLCREAQRIDAPMGAADLCRSVYGR
ncbi:hypothetical protein [Streptomyces sp. NPDC004435]|uniref:hypothetical protein n=1 Tax=Streptomyces sp. NPDC004435 TaxID=3364701 RepID=UPI0036B778EA